MAVALLPKLQSKAFRPAPELLLGTRPKTSGGYIDAYTPLGAGSTRCSSSLVGAAGVARRRRQQNESMTGLTYFEIAQGQAFERCAHGAAAAAVERSQKKLSDQRTAGRISQAAAKLVVLDALRRVAARRFITRAAFVACRDAKANGASSTDADAAAAVAAAACNLRFRPLPCRPRVVCRDEAKDAREALVASAAASENSKAPQGSVRAPRGGRRRRADRRRPAAPRARALRDRREGPEERSATKSERAPQGPSKSVAGVPRGPAADPPPRRGGPAAEPINGVESEARIAPAAEGGARFRRVRETQVRAVATELLQRFAAELAVRGLAPVRRGAGRRRRAREAADDDGDDAAGGGAPAPAEEARQKTAARVDGVPRGPAPRRRLARLRGTMHRAFARQQRARKPYWLEPPPIQWAVPPATPKTPSISWAAPLAMPRTPASRPGTGCSATPTSRPGTRGSDKAPLQAGERPLPQPRSAKSVSFAKTAAEDTPKRKGRPRSVRFSLPDTPEAVVRPGGASPALFDAAPTPKRALRRRLARARAHAARAAAPGLARGVGRLRHGGEPPGHDALRATRGPRRPSSGRGNCSCCRVPLPRRPTTAVPAPAPRPHHYGRPRAVCGATRPPGRLDRSRRLPRPAPRTPRGAAPARGVVLLKLTPAARRRAARVCETPATRSLETAAQGNAMPVHVLRPRR